jgi:aldehyde:ferredoxin oxidoreductase
VKGKQSLKGFFNTCLLVDLDSQSWKRIDPAAANPAQNLGGKGLGLRLLNHFSKDVPDPLGPENPLILATGPAADSSIAGCSRWIVMTRSPQTGFLAHSYSGGRLATPMSRTGYDAFVILGRSEKQVWIEITPERVVFHDAGDLRGMDTHATEKILLKHIDARVGAMVVGPAAENGVRFANISNDKWRQAGRTGAGTVMASKNVKGIAFKGEKRRPHADPEAIRRYGREIASTFKENPAVLKYRRHGTPMMVAVMNNAQAFPSRYWRQGVLEGWEKISGDHLLCHMKVTPKACEQCFMACGKLSEVLDGPYKGLVVEGPEYETLFAFGGLCMITDLGEILHLNDLCDRLGMDTITTGNLVAFAMEATELGKFPETIRYGDAEAAVKLVEKIALRQGSGAVLADGIIPAAQALGLEDLAIHVKGLEPAGYDPRVLKGMALAYGVSDRGACHLRTTFYKAELAGMIDKDATTGKAEMLIDFEDRATLFDSLILCRFYRDLYTWDQLSRIVHMITGMTLDKSELAALAAGITDDARRFNIRMGLTRDHDLLPERFHTEPVVPSHAVISREQYEAMLADYYRLRGWDAEGVPIS